LKAKDRHRCKGCDRQLVENTMKRKLKKKLWLSVAVIAVLAGVTAAAVMAAQPAATHAHHHHHHRKGGTLATAARYLGSSPAQLQSELQSGNSLAEIANATSGKSEAGLIAALEAADRQRLANLAARLPARITARVDRQGARRRRLTQAPVAGRKHGSRARAAAREHRAG
jgi:hypothetical protein